MDTFAGSIAICLLLSCGITVGQTTGTATATPKFDRNRAFEDLVRQCEFGPRLPSSPGIEKTRALVLSVLEQNGFTTGSQNFTARSQLLGKSIPGVNLYGTYPKGLAPKYLLSCHYDTRPFADQDSSPENQSKPVIGANDGASGVAVLLELARAIPAMNLPHGVGLVFFDVEDHGMPTQQEGFCLGSQYMAANLPPELQFKYGINIDMIGDADLRLPAEGYSMNKAPELTRRVWEVGARLYPQIFLKSTGAPVFDDHVPFLSKGMNYINIIDFHYPSWHTTADTIDKCSPESLEAVGLTLLHFIQN